ncbi:MAG: succinate dehydrogenase cytochrome b subunit [Acidobacteriota bacterium]
MPRKAPELSSTVAKKVLMALTGLALFVFLVGHLGGNLLLFSGDPVVFNSYSHVLVSSGWVLIVVELLLLTVFLAHIVQAIWVTWKNRQARPERYHRVKSAGRPSRKTLASSTMIWTGLILLVFTALHLYTFKYGPGIQQGYATQINGEQMRDLHRLVSEVFHRPLYVLWYVAAMTFLGFHLRHGFWSAFQSLGAYHPRYTPVVSALGYIFALLLGLGFLAIPLWIYFFQGVS